MFDYLYYSVFPILGEFFGKLSALAACSIEQFLDTFLNVTNYNGISLIYKNFFTGVSSSFVPLQALPNGIRRILGGLSSVAFLGVPTSYPVWLGMILSCVEIYLLIAIVSFLRKVIKG